MRTLCENGPGATFCLKDVDLRALQIDKYVMRCNWMTRYSSLFDDDVSEVPLRLFPLTKNKS
jgi:hypothetical protein